MNDSVSTKRLLVLPVLNELKNLEILLPKIWLVYPELAIVIIDDNSLDQTEEYIKHLQISGHPISHIRRPKKMGIGRAHLDGLLYGIRHQYEYIITMDADLTHRPEDLASFIGFGGTSDLLIGSRYLDESNMVGWSVFRRLLTKVGHLVTFISFRQNWDMSSGMRMYKTKTIPINILEVNCPPDYAFFFVSAIAYQKVGLEVSQLPIQLEKRNAGKSKMNLSLIVKGIVLLMLHSLRIKRIRAN